MPRKKTAQDFGTILTVDQAAERLNVSPAQIRRLALTGELNAVKIGTRPGRRGGRYLIPEQSLFEWFDRNRNRF